MAEGLHGEVRHGTPWTDLAAQTREGGKQQELEHRGKICGSQMQRGSWKIESRDDRPMRRQDGGGRTHPETVIRAESPSSMRRY